MRPTGSTSTRTCAAATGEKRSIVNDRTRHLVFLQVLRSCVLHRPVYAIAVVGRPGGLDVYMFGSRDPVFHQS